MKKTLYVTLTLFCIVFVGFFCFAQAQTISDIVDADYTSVKYPVRDNALIVILQPVPDNSGDYTMTICNKNSHCRQTSMLYSELRYIGLFLEDSMSAMQNDLNRKLTIPEWKERQQAFRDVYAGYMNMYDQRMGVLKSFTSGIVWVKPEENVNPRYKAGQSNEEICVRNGGGTVACMEDANYSKLVAGIMKNGGCITSVPDLGYMYRDLNYCKKTNEKINVIYLPSGDVKIINKDMDWNFNVMTDKEYQAEMADYRKRYK